MKSFWKTVLACALGVLAAGIIISSLWSVMFASLLGSMFTQIKTEVPQDAIVDIDMSKLIIGEQTLETDFMQTLSADPTFNGDYMDIRTVGILDAVNALEQAANDPRIKACWLRADEATDISHLEEFRSALVKFHDSGKPVYAYVETPTNAGFWLASCADRIYMSPYTGGVNALIGLSGQMTYFKDLLDKFGVNIQLIRHGKYKSAGEPFICSHPSKENIEQQQVMIDGLWKEMATPIADRAHMTLEEFNTLIDNLSLCNSSDFLAKGLVDETTGLAGMKEKLCEIAGEDDFDDIQSISFADYVDATKEVSMDISDKIAIIYADGEIVDGYGAEEVCGKTFAEMIDAVRDDDDIKGVVLRVNSPGGSVIAASQIKEAIDQLQTVKPVVASYGSYAASGGYWISAGCERIFSDATTLTGSIGVFGMVPDLSRTMSDVAHINVTPISSNSHSDMYSLMRPLTKEEIDFTQKDIEEIYSNFTSLVAQGRNMTVEEVDSIGQGRVWTGRDAIANGLVDEIGGLKEALEYTASICGCACYEVENYPKPLTSMEQLLFSVGEIQDERHLVEIYQKIEELKEVKILARMPYSMVIR